MYTVHFVIELSGLYSLHNGRIHIILKVLWVRPFNQARLRLRSGGMGSGRIHCNKLQWLFHGLTIFTFLDAPIYIFKLYGLAASWGTTRPVVTAVCVRLRTASVCGYARLRTADVEGGALCARLTSTS